MIAVRGRRFLVTGGTGFIGSALVRALVARGALVRSLDDNSRGGVARLADVVDQVDLITGDI
jgi:nucleoside-diphosphate-sugar epimerase